MDQNNVTIIKTTQGNDVKVVVNGSVNMSDPKLMDLIKQGVFCAQSENGSATMTFNGDITF